MRHRRTTDLFHNHEEGGLTRPTLESLCSLDAGLPNGPVSLLSQRRRSALPVLNRDFLQLANEVTERPIGHRGQFRATRHH